MPTPTPSPLLIVKSTAVFPAACYLFISGPFCIYKANQKPAFFRKGYDGISPALPWQNFGQSPAYFHGFPPPSPGPGGPWLLVHKGFISLRLLNILMDLVDTLHDVRYWSEVYTVIITLLNDLEVKVIDLEIFILKFLVEVFRSLYLLNMRMDLVDMILV